MFANEPLVRIAAPIIEAQLVETLVLNQIHFQSIAATKASRVVAAAEGRKVVDFGSRRAHGTDAALKVARTSYLAGAAGTSNVLAGKQYGIPTFGTMAHSYIQAHDDETAALKAFARLFPQTTLLVDTYDTLEGVRLVIRFNRQVGDDLSVRAVRLDSGDLAELARQTRKLLDESGLKDVRIIASSGLDEYKIYELLRKEAPIDGFGVGTNLAVSNDAPSLDMAYKLVGYAGRPRMKLSSGKTIYPGSKQVFRKFQDGCMAGDVIGSSDEQLEGQPLLQSVLRNGRRLPDASPPLVEVRDFAKKQFEQLPEPLKAIEKSKSAYEVQISDRLEQQRQKVESIAKQNSLRSKSS